MAIFNEEQFKIAEEQSQLNFLQATLGRNSDDSAEDLLMSTDTGMAPGPAIEPGSVQERIISTYLGTRAATLNTDTPDMDDVSLGDAPSTERNVVETNMNSLYVGDPEINYRSRKAFAFESTRMQSFDTAMKQSIERWRNKDSSLPIPAEEANQIAKDEGADIKFDKPVSSFALHQAIDTYKRREQLAESIAYVQSTGSQGRFNDAMVLASGMAGGVGPVEFIASTAIGIAAPELVVAGLAKGASVVSNTLKTKKVLDAVKAMDKFRTANTMAKAMGNPIGLAAIKRTSATIVDAEKVGELERATVTAMNKLENIAGLKYEALTNLEKTGLDTLAFTVADVPFIEATRANSNELGFDLYTEQDKAIDTLLAAGLGIAVPSTFRAVGRVLGFVPNALLARKLGDIEATIKTKEALGDITEAEAKEAKEAIKTIRKNQEELGKMIRPTHEALGRAADQLARMNVSDETLTAQRMFVMNELLNGNRPKIHMIPQYESLMSHIDSLLIKRLKLETLDEVFGRAVYMENPAPFIHAVKIRGEDGLLGKASMYALTADKAKELQRIAYRAHVLGDAEAMKILKTYADKFSEFEMVLRQLYADIEEQVNAAKTTKIPLVNQINIRERMQDAWLRLHMEDEALKEYKARVDYNKWAEANGYPEAGIDDILGEAMNGFDEFYNQYVRETQLKRGTAYDLVGLKNKDKSSKETSFGEFLDELHKAAGDVATIADLDDTIMNWNADKVRNFVDEASKLDVSHDTDINNLFGLPRITYGKLKELETDSVYWSNKAMEARAKYEKMKGAEDTNTLLNKALKHSVREEGNKGVLRRCEDIIEMVQKLREEGYQSLKDAILERARTDNKFQARIRTAIESGTGYRGIVHTMRDLIAGALAETEVGKLVGTPVEALNAVIADFEKRIKEDAKATLEPFLTGDYAKEIEKIPEFGPSREKILQAAARNQVTFESVVDPIVKALGIQLDRIEIQSMYDMSNIVSKLKVMLTIPETAAEVLTGAATSTPYVFQGAHNSIEYMSKSAGLYMNSVKNTLREMDSSNKGRTLLEVFGDNKSRDDIFDAVVRVSRGETGLENSDAERIAEVLLSHEATFKTGFSEFGAQYKDASSLIQRGKLLHAEVAMPMEEIINLQSKVEDVHMVNVDDIINSLERNEEGLVKVGDKWVTPDSALASKYNKMNKEIQKAIIDITNLANENDEAIVAWVFRDGNLDEMFSEINKTPLSMNEVRDALLNNRLGELVGSDLNNLYYTKTIMNSLRSRLIGRQATKVVTDIGTKWSPSGTSWIYQFKAGFRDLSAVDAGRKAAALDAMQHGIIFKDADSEMYATRLFGYDSVDEAFGARYSTLLNAYFALKNFGTHPIDTVEDIVNIYNKLIKGDAQIKESLLKMARGINQDIESKFVITQGALDSIKENVKLECGLANKTQSTSTRVIKLLTRLTSFSLLAKAGLKSFSDQGTIWQGIAMNGLASGKGASFGALCKAINILAQNKSLLERVLSCQLIEGDTLLKMLTNESASDMVRAKYSNLEKAEDFVQGASNTFMNTFGRMEWITNMNKLTAATAIQQEIGKMANTSFDELSSDFKKMLIRDGVGKDDWDFVRKHAMWDVAEYAEKFEGKKFRGKSSTWLIPMSLDRIGDDVFEAELKRRGAKNITSDMITEFKLDIKGRLWNMVDASADEFISIPTGRQENVLRAGKARNTGWGTALEIANQFKAFGASLMYHTYGKTLANIAADEVGCSILDLFSPAVKISWGTRARAYNSILGAFLRVGIVTLLVESTVNAMSGQIQRPIDEEGNWHVDTYISSLLGATGLVGTLADASIEAVSGSGQASGGIAMQMAPSLSNVLRVGYRLKQTLTSKDVGDDARAQALGAAAIQEVARITGAKSLPIISLVYQNFAGAYLDSMVRGGQDQYAEYINRRVRERGMVPMPWEINPQLGGQFAR